MQSMKIYSYYLKFQPHNIESLAKVKFEKSLEKTFIAKDGEGRFIFHSQFNCVAFVGYSDKEASAYARMLGASEDSLQDFAISIDATIPKSFAIKDNSLVLKSSSVEQISIAALAVMQSVGLDLYEARLDDELNRSRDILIKRPSRFFASQKLVDFVRSSALLRHELVSDLMLLDKPLIVWDNDDCDTLYDALSKFFELKERFDVIEYKIALLKDDLIFIVDTEQNNKSVFLEWIIIILITVEVIMGLVKFKI
ncbi:MAG: hypothetical protein RL154_1703 [Pseudomonadota bacterium]|jgi:uncharacterized Rmd1/YagE family protein